MVESKVLYTPDTRVDLYNANSTITLVLNKVDGNWLIVSVEEPVTYDEEKGTVISNMFPYYEIIYSGILKDTEYYKSKVGENSPEYDVAIISFTKFITAVFEGKINSVSSAIEHGAYNYPESINQIVIEAKEVHDEVANGYVYDIKYKNSKVIFVGKHDDEIVSVVIESEVYVHNEFYGKEYYLMVKDFDGWKLVIYLEAVEEWLTVTMNQKSTNQNW